jgi:hypothetical protein
VHLRRRDGRHLWTNNKAGNRLPCEGTDRGTLFLQIMFAAAARGMALQRLFGTVKPAMTIRASDGVRLCAFHSRQTPALDQLGTDQDQAVVGLGSAVFSAIREHFLQAALFKKASETKRCAWHQRSADPSDRHEKTNPTILGEPYAAVSLHAAPTLHHGQGNQEHRYQFHHQRDALADQSDRQATLATRVGLCSSLHVSYSVGHRIHCFKLLGEGVVAHDCDRQVAAQQFAPPSSIARLVWHVQNFNRAYALMPHRVCGIKTWTDLCNKDLPCFD